MSFTHLDDAGRARMVDVTGKQPTVRSATAAGFVRCAPHVAAVDLAVEDDGVRITATVRTADRTGVEMEALTAVSVAALAVVDMVQGMDKEAVITDIRVESKTGGKS